MISRRDAMKLGAAALAAAAAHHLQMPTFASHNESGTWNRRGNPGQTGEWPGPRLALDGPVGELWRMPAHDNAVSVLAYLDGILYTARQQEPPWSVYTTIDARNGADGALLWAVEAADVDDQTILSESPSPSYFWGDPIIDNNQFLISHEDPDGNQSVVAIDCATGEIQWNTPLDLRFIMYDHAAFLGEHSFAGSVSLGDPLEINWVREDLESVSDTAIDQGLLYLLAREHLHALRTENGIEYWRISLDDPERRHNIHGVNNGTIALQSDGNEDQSSLLTAVTSEGNVAWSIDDNDHNSSSKWMVKDNITRMTPKSSVFDFCQFQNLSLDTGEVNWDFELNTERWGTRWDDDYPTICDGVGYVRIKDHSVNDHILIAVDPTAATIYGAQGVNLRPLLVTEGVMIARDEDDDELVVIGTVSPSLRAGGRAETKTDAVLRGASNDSAIERGTVVAGSLVQLTGDADNDWYPVSIVESGESGWIQSAELEGITGDIVFEPMDISEFGQFTDYRR